MNQYINNFLNYKQLLWELVARDIKTKYRRSTLGVLWTLLNPLLMMIVLSIVFSNLFRFSIENFPLYLLSGQVIFTFYNESTSNGMTSIIGNAGLIKKVYIPKYLFTLSRILSSTINIMASYCALILVMLFTRAELHYTILLSFFPILLLMVMATGIGLILAAVTVKFRDILHLYSVFLTALMYLTPVIYPISILPGWVYKIVMLNPLTGIMEMFRGFMIYGTFPSLLTVAYSILVAIIFFTCGLYVFYKQQDTFILNV